MPQPKTPPTRYEVRSAITGAVVCGPYDSKSDADREKKRLNKEAATGRTEPSDHFPNGQQLSAEDGDPLRHEGLPMRYEVVTVEGVVLAGE